MPPRKLIRPASRSLKAQSRAIMQTAITKVGKNFVQAASLDLLTDTQLFQRLRCTKIDTLFALYPLGSKRVRKMIVSAIRHGNPD